MPPHQAGVLRHRLMSLGCLCPSRPQVYGDLGTSPLYTYSSIFSQSDLGTDENTILGVFSMVRGDAQERRCAINPEARPPRTRAQQPGITRPHAAPGLLDADNGHHN